MAASPPYVISVYDTFRARTDGGPAATQPPAREDTSTFAAHSLEFLAAFGHRQNAQEPPGRSAPRCLSLLGSEGLALYGAIMPILRSGRLPEIRQPVMGTLTVTTERSLRFPD